jgi:hypothetical protein
VLSKEMRDIAAFMDKAEEEKLYAFFYETVLLRYVAYKTTRNELESGTRSDLKSAIEASIAAYHFREHLPDIYKNSRSEMEAICADYVLLGDVVDASKHKHLDRKNRRIDSSDNIREQVVYTRYRDEAGEYTDATKSIEITLRDGTRRELFDVLTNVINMWIQFLGTKGISGKATQFPHEDRPDRSHSNQIYEFDLLPKPGYVEQSQVLQYWSPRSRL